MVAVSRAAILNPAWSLQFMSGLYADQGWARAWSALAASRRTAPNLALLGNCGSVATPLQKEQTTEFLLRCSAAWEKIFWVPGPHELASPSKELMVDQLHSLRQVAANVMKETGGTILILDKSEYACHADDVVLLGITGWPDLLGNGIMPLRPATSIEATRLWTAGGDTGGHAQNIQPGDIQKWNAESLQWIRERISWWNAYRPGMRKVVLTHHLCTASLLSSGLSLAVYERASLDVMSDYSTADLLGNRAGVSPTAWLCGATGSSCTGLLRNGTFIGVNSLFGAEGGGAAAAANPRWMADRRFELSPVKVRME